MHVPQDKEWILQYLLWDEEKNHFKTMNQGHEQTILKGTSSSQYAYKAKLSIQELKLRQNWDRKIAK